MIVAAPPALTAPNPWRCNRPPRRAYTRNEIVCVLRVLVPRVWLARAECIVRLESDYDVNSVGSQGELGIWQLHPVHFGDRIGGVRVTPNTARHPVTATLIARGLSHGFTDMHDWSTARYCPGGS